MRVLFISLSDMRSITEHGLYSDLLREFVRYGHAVTILSPVERRTRKHTEVYEEAGAKFIKVKVGNIQKTNYIEKMISILLLKYQILNSIKRYCGDIEFDLILYATPPVTIAGVIEKIKNKTKARTILMLKDIWPQEMVDLGLISDRGFIYRYFKRLEGKIYAISDKIGYTSLANKNYLMSEGVPECKLIAINNSVDVTYKNKIDRKSEDVLNKYAIDFGSTIFFYGGNLGKPQDIDYLIDCLMTQVNKDDRSFIICGQGTEYKKLEMFFNNQKPRNMLLLPYLPKEEYDQLIMASDVGMVFLNHRFTVPNCPSRFYTYMEYSKSVLACTDTATDIKDDINTGEFGWWIKSDSVSAFQNIIDAICQEGKSGLMERGKKARVYLENNFTVDKDYQRIMRSMW